MKSPSSEALESIAMEWEKDYVTFKGSSLVVESLRRWARQIRQSKARRRKACGFKLKKGKK